MRCRLAAVALVGIASCGDNLAPTVTITADGAAWLAVEADGRWTRYEASPVTVVARGRYQAVVVCKADVGLGWSVVAYAEDVPAVTYPCAAAEPAVGDRVAVGFASGVDVEVNFAGRSLVIPADGAIDVPRGTYDVVAHTLPQLGDPRPPRVEVLRNLSITDARQVALHVDRVGIDAVPAGITVRGALAQYTTVVTATAGGSWFRNGGVFQQPWVLSATAVRATDRSEATVTRDHGWARFPYRGPVDLRLPDEPVAATLRWAPLPVAEVVTAGDWHWLGLWVGDLELRKWQVWAEPALVAAEGELRLAAPAVDGWNPAWLPDPARPSWWELRWTRDREGGGFEGRHAGTVFLSP